VPGVPAKVLVVDDHPLNLKLVRVLLESEGYQVKTATNAAEALEALGGFRAQLLLVDIQLPDLDGLELTRRVRLAEATRDLPIVAVTAYAMKGDAEKMLGAGCDAYVPKPIDTRALVALVGRLLATAAPGGG
jgi:CheY-like chemotaxis protein